MRSRTAVLIALALGACPAAAAAQPQEPAPPPPPLNRVNTHLPSWLYVRGEFRERMEGLSGAGFVGGRDDLYWLSRLRVDVTARPASRLLFAVQVQDARVAGKDIGPTAAPFSGAFDLRQAYVEIRSFADDTADATGAGDAPSVVARVGRQELAFGEQRLVGHVSWLNTARTFDGARLSLRRGGVLVDAFAASVVRIQRGELDKSGNGNRFVGGYVSTAGLVPRATVEPFVFWRGDRALATEAGERGDLEAVTVGTRVAGRINAALDYDLEVALQRGSLGADDVRAWAGHWRLRTALPGAARVRILTEYNYASGDADPADGRRGTFDQLYPTPHDKYGLADQVGWKNIHHVRVGAEVLRWTGWPVSAGYHAWWLAETADALYNAGGAPIARVAGGASARRVGQEIDVQVARTLTPQLQLAAGYAHIVPGPFRREATPGTSYRAPFVMATYVFLADK